ncbi:MAG: SpvB/TcaC N-terminal domain-containing protein [Chitinophagaceae bacterium]
MRKLLLSTTVLLLQVMNSYGQPDVTKPVGTIPGSLTISMGGAATYNIPIQVPSGLAGLQPRLSLVYNSRLNDGIAGYGWNLSGISAITRGPQTKLYNGNVSPLELDSDDNFYLDGQLLIPTTGINGGDETQYSMEAETFFKIESVGGFNGNPDFWRITQKDGSTVEYGIKPEDKLVTTANISWMISRSTDVNKNLVSYAYQSLEGEVILDRITYGNTAVSFEYSDKENKNITFENGKSMIDSRILIKINIIQDGVTKQHVGLQHTRQLKRNYLTGVELYGTDGQSILTKFDYGLIAQEEAGSTIQGTYDVVGHNWSLTPGDYNGDGKSDLVVANILYKVEDDNIKSTSSSLYNLGRMARQNHNGRF